MPRVFLVSCRHLWCTQREVYVTAPLLLFTPLEKPIFREVNFKEENSLGTSNLRKSHILGRSKIFHVLCGGLQPADLGWPTGYGKKLSRSQAQLGQATCLAVA